MFLKNQTSTLCKILGGSCRKSGM